MVRRCLVEVSGGNGATKIYRNRFDAIMNGTKIENWPRELATAAIRRKVYNRAKQSCERCGKPLTWDQMHMDEKVPRSKGGHISLENSWCLCADCHILSPESEHGDRRWNGIRAV